MVEKKVNETELGYVIYEGKDLVTQLLSGGLARLRGDKIQSEHMEDYLDAEEEAKMGERGVWSEENKPRGAFRYLQKNLAEDQFFKENKGNQKLSGIVEEIHPSKAVVYFPEEGFITTLTFSDIQVVVLSEKS